MLPGKKSKLTRATNSTCAKRSLFCARQKKETETRIKFNFSRKGLKKTVTLGLLQFWVKRKGRYFPGKGIKCP